jgi:uncharacterized protein YbjT (DUF2867 family)
MRLEMKLTIFAATGGIGGHALEQALAAGHDVTAVVRNPMAYRTQKAVSSAYPQNLLPS